MTKKLQLSLCLFTLILSSLTSFAMRIGSANEPWKTLSTPHFEIFYSARQQDLGLYYGRIAEQAYLRLSEVFEIRPQEKVAIIINDSTDSSNGFSTLIPYPYIMIYPVQVDTNDSLSEAGEWARELITHELTHTLQLYPAEGFYKYLKPVFGSIVAPNILTPSWWKEGMAVEMETEFSPQGRSRSYFQAATIRALVEAGKLSDYSLAEINETLPTWPYGSRPYIFGSMLMGEMNAEKKHEGINWVVKTQAERFPFFVEKPHMDVYNQTYESHYLQTLRKYKRIAEDQIAEVQAHTQSNYRIIDTQLITSKNPSKSTLWNILALIAQEKDEKRIVFYEKNNDNWQKLKIFKNPTGTITSIDFHPTEKKLLYTKIDQVDSKNEFSDLYIFDLDQNKSTAITKSARARQAKWSPDGQNIFYISTFDGKTQVNQFNFSSKKNQVLYSGDFQNRITEIEPLNSNEILFLNRNANGDNSVEKLNISEKTKTTIEIKHKNIFNLKLIHQTLYFTATDNGIKNIYGYDLLKNKSTAFTNLVTGAMSFDIDQNHGTLFATVFTDKGYEVAELPLEARSAPLPQIENPIRDRYQFQETSKSDQTTSTPAAELESDAKVFPYILPQYWIPFIATTSNSNGVDLQIMTSGQDPLLRHVYGLSADYDSSISKFSYDVNYTNSTLTWPLIFEVKQTHRSYGTKTNLVDKTLTMAGFQPDVFTISPDLVMNIGLTQTSTKDSVITTSHNGIFADLIYSSIKKTIFYNYPFSGQSLYFHLEHNKNTQDQQSDFYGDYTQAIASANLYHSRFLPESHTLLWKISSLYSFQNISSRFGTSNTVFPLFSDAILPSFHMRGYLDGQFYGSQLTTSNLEYRFPMRTLNRGSGTDPYFLKNIDGAITVDGIAVKGGSIDKNGVFLSETTNHSMWSVGAEARLSTTLGYLLPVNFILGYYIPLSPKYQSSSQMSLSLQLGGFNH